MGKVEVEITAYSNTLFWYNDRTYRHIDQCATGSKPVATKISEPLWRDIQKDIRKYLTTTMSPARHSRISRTKKSIFGAPIPMLMMERGTPK